MARPQRTLLLPFRRFRGWTLTIGNMFFLFLASCLCKPLWRSHLQRLRGMLPGGNAMLREINMRAARRTREKSVREAGGPEREGRLGGRAGAWQMRQPICLATIVDQREEKRRYVRNKRYDSRDGDVPPTMQASPLSRRPANGTFSARSAGRGPYCAHPGHLTKRGRCGTLTTFRLGRATNSQGEQGS